MIAWTFAATPHESATQASDYSPGTRDGGGSFDCKQYRPPRCYELLHTATVLAGTLARRLWFVWQDIDPRPASGRRVRGAMNARRSYKNARFAASSRIGRRHEAGPVSSAVTPGQSPHEIIGGRLARRPVVRRFLDHRKFPAGDPESANLANDMFRLYIGD